ncbi:MAG TPA: xanthine dehydrogenase family protein molybdopterin-binding subunit [Gemmatimonadaceae bacterium]
MSHVPSIDRREFVKLGAIAGAGLVIGIRLPSANAGSPHAAAPLKPNAFLRVDPDGAITIWLGRSDMGQGVRTSLPMIVADELDADWSRVTVQQADAHPTAFGRMMTVGSTSVRNGAWMPLRNAGAAAREMLVAAAAARLAVPASELTTGNSVVRHRASGRTLTYGELADAAAALPIPERPKLKDPAAFRLIGTRVPLVDTRLKVTGAAKFGIDARVPGMLFATVVRPPVFGDSLKSFDATSAKAVKGVKDVVAITSGVAVIADSTWAALKGARQLQIQWTPGGFTMGSDQIFAHLSQKAESPGVAARTEGNAESALARAAKRLNATYEAPYLAHATMEPMNCTAHVRADGVEIWAPTQNPQGTQSTAARLTGLPVDKVTVHVMYLGCGWGRRSSTDFVQDAVEASMKAGAPVQVLWTREEDMQHDNYRPATHIRIEGGVDGSGKVVALRARIAAQPIAGGRGAFDGPAVAGISNMLYGMPNVSVEWSRPDLRVPVGYWRSVGPSQNVFVLESFIDELALAAGRDPVEVRRELLAHESRMLRVLNLVAERSGWGTPPPAGRARGVALAEDTQSLVAEVAEVSLVNGRPRVHKVWCVADCGRVIHPGIAEAQFQGAIAGGLGAALYGEITIENGRTKQSNFNDFRLLRMSDMPEVDVYFVPSEEEPGGVGEPGVPPIAPAVCNALFKLTGTRIRKLPIRAEMLGAVGNGSSR